MSKKIVYTKVYDKYCKLFREHCDDIEGYNYYKDLYIKIRTYYEKKMEDKDFNINVEKIKLESRSGNYNGMTFTNISNILVVAISIFLNGIILALSVSETNDKYRITILGAVLSFAILMFIIKSVLYKDTDSEYLYSVCLRVIEDIEKEVVIKLVKEEKSEKLEILQRIEKYHNDQDEVATTYDKIIDNTENDKNAKGNGKYIKGFINIIINKRISK